MKSVKGAAKCETMCTTIFGIAIEELTPDLVANNPSVAPIKVFCGEGRGSVAPDPLMGDPPVEVSVSLVHPTDVPACHLFLEATAVYDKVDEHLETRVVVLTKMTIKADDRIP